MDLIGIVAPKGLYISDNVTADGYHRSGIGGLIVNGSKVKPTFHKDWWLIEDASTIETCKVTQRQKNINFRFVLRDAETFASFNVPRVITDDLVYQDYEWSLPEIYAHLESLYYLESDKQPDIEVDVEFNLTIVLELEEDLVDYERFSYPRVKKWDVARQFVTNANVNHKILDRIIFPTLVLPSRPCVLTSGESYDLVREHVKRNINPKAATITSDYDFCFTVQKVVSITKPYSFQREIKTARGKSYRKRRYRTVYVNHRKMVVFEMTWAGARNRGSTSGYQGYTIIKGFEGANEGELHDNIEAYLTELMDVINAPLIDCPHCNGMGVIWDETKFPTNGSNDDSP